MRPFVGVYGKLPAKRDFVSMGTPRHIVEPWENWLQAGVAASRNRLGRNWQNIYLTAPIWNFWIGDLVLGQAVTGALVSSLDRLERMFPFSILRGFGDDSLPTAPPLHPATQWYEHASGLLMKCLDEANPLSRDPGRIVKDAALAGLRNDEPAVDHQDAILLNGEAGATSHSLLEELNRLDRTEAVRHRSYWWTSGRTGSGPTAFASDGLPKPTRYLTMLTGQDYG